MSDGQEPTAEGQEPTPAPEQVQDDKPKMYPQEYVEQLRQEAADRRVKAKELEDKLAAMERQELAEQEKWQELAQKYEARVQELEPVKAQYEAMLNRLSESNQQRIEGLPEAMRTLVPEYDDPSKLAAWLDANADKLRKPTAPSLNGGAGSGDRPGSKVVLNEQQRKTARKLGLTDEQYSEYLN